MKWWNQCSELVQIQLEWYIITKGRAKQSTKKKKKRWVLVSTGYKLSINKPHKISSGNVTIIQKKLRVILYAKEKDNILALKNLVLWQAN